MKKKVLIFIDWYKPGFKAGGPIQSIDGMVQRLSQHLEFNIITADRDLGDASSYLGVEKNKWVKVDGANIYYCSYGVLGNLKLFITLLKENYDTLYLNSLFSIRSCFVPLLAKKLKFISAKKTVIATRGELSTGALSIKKNKKSIFLSVLRKINFYNGVSWHASNIEESKEIIDSLRIKSKRIYIANNLFPVSKGANLESIHKNVDSLRLVYFSRISCKKNLAFAIEILDEFSGDIELDIFGPLEDISYWHGVCKPLISKSRKKINYRGVLDHQLVHTTLSKYHFFILPTLGENYGHAIREALESGLPIIISDRTPWKSLEDLGVGWSLNLENKHEWIDVIDKCLRMSNKEYVQYSSKVRIYASSQMLSDETIKSNLSIFSEAV